MNIIYVTTFAADMYEASGRHLIESFAAQNTEGFLLACTENMNDIPVSAQHNVAYVPVGEDPFLVRWLKQHEDIIPDHLGGKAKGACLCRGGPFEAHDKRHKMPCIGYWFCRNASRWFRKVVALHKASELFGGGRDTVLIWIDSDCRFTDKVTKPVVQSWFPGRAAVFYHKFDRPVLEAGIVGYRLDAGARKVLDLFFEVYRSDFRSYDRWDDSYVLQKVVFRLRTTVPSVDLATGKGANAAVIPFSPVGRYIEHRKGSHNARHGIGIMT